jgi:hypothetical protein
MNTERAKGCWRGLNPDEQIEAVLRDGLSERLDSGGQEVKRYRSHARTWRFGKERLLTDAHSNLYTTRSTRPPTWYGTVEGLAVALPEMHACT